MVRLRVPSTTYSGWTIYKRFSDHQADNQSKQVYSYWEIKDAKDMSPSSHWSTQSPQNAQIMTRRELYRLSLGHSPFSSWQPIPLKPTPLQNPKSSRIWAPEDQHCEPQGLQRPLPQEPSPLTLLTNHCAISNSPFSYAQQHNAQLNPACLNQVTHSYVVRKADFIIRALSSKAECSIWTSPLNLGWQCNSSFKAGQFS